MQSGSRRTLSAEVPAYSRLTGSGRTVSVKPHTSKSANSLASPLSAQIDMNALSRSSCMPASSWLESPR